MVFVETKRWLGGRPMNTKRILRPADDASAQVSAKNTNGSYKNANCAPGHARTRSSPKPERWCARARRRDSLRRAGHCLQRAGALCKGRLPERRRRLNRPISSARLATGAANGSHVRAVTAHNFTALAA